MFKRLISLFVAAAALIASSLVALPAQAAGTATLPSRFDVVSLKALPNNRAFVLGYVITGSYKNLVGYAISSDGILGDQIVFETNARMAFGAIETSPITVFADGSVALAWTVNNDTLGSSTLNARFSADGSTWGPITHPAPTLTSSCSISSSYMCYYVTPRIAQDGKGQVAVAYGTKVDSGKAFIAVTKDKATWSAPLVQTYTGYSPSIGFLYGLTAGGFEVGGPLCYRSSCSYWISTIDPKGAKFSAKGNFAPSYISQISYSSFADVQAINPTTAVIPIAATSNDFNFAWATFSTVTGKWAAVKTLKVPGASIFYKTPVSTVDVEGRLTYVFASRALDASRNQTGRDNYFKISFEPGSLVATTQLIGDAPSETPPAITKFRNLYTDADNQLHLVMDLGSAGSAVEVVLTQAGLNNPQTITQLRSGETYRAITTTSGNQITTVSSDGSIYYSGDANYVQTIRQADKPRLTSNITVSGKNQKGATLTVGATTFIGNNPVDSVTIDWYACAAATTKLSYGAVPVNCTLVSTGSSNTYKVKPTDKGKFVGVAETGHIGSLSTVVFSKTTAKIK